MLCGGAPDAMGSTLVFSGVCFIISSLCFFLLFMNRIFRCRNSLMSVAVCVLLFLLHCGQEWRNVVHGGDGGSYENEWSE